MDGNIVRTSRRFIKTFQFLGSPKVSLGCQDENPESAIYLERRRNGVTVAAHVVALHNDLIDEALSQHNVLLTFEADLSSLVDPAQPWVIA